jgi:hypothetical protein
MRTWDVGNYSLRIWQAHIENSDKYSFSLNLYLYENSGNAIRNALRRCHVLIHPAECQNSASKFSQYRSEWWFGVRNMIFELGHSSSSALRWSDRDPCVAY